MAWPPQPASTSLEISSRDYFHWKNNPSEAIMCSYQSVPIAHFCETSRENEFQWWASSSSDSTYYIFNEACERSDIVESYPRPPVSTQYTLGSPVDGLSSSGDFEANISDPRTSLLLTWLNISRFLGSFAARRMATLVVPTQKMAQVSAMDPEACDQGTLTLSIQK